MRVLAALSGGVDSSVAALLLQREGHDVVGAFMRNGVSGAEAASHKSCCSASDARDAARVADRLGVPFYAVDYAAEFGSIIDHFVAEYARGRTPNPCVLCNQRLKFGHLLQLGEQLGVDAVATGHYARVDAGVLRVATDLAKDQSYYLFGVARSALPRMLFPIGHLVKDDVRALAREAGLATADKPESMEICFVPSGDYRDVVRARGGLGKSGRIVDEAGRELGRHDGVGNFTVGQRRGLPAMGEPWFVKRLDPASGDVVICPRSGIETTLAAVDGINWLIDPPAAPLDVAVKVRARSAPAPARVVPTSATTATLTFTAPLAAITPGQAAVFYRGEDVLGGGWLQ
jgi:tRNA-specific 2-thiouridylase